jgi:hypothetical protein
MKTWLLIVMTFACLAAGAQEGIPSEEARNQERDRLTKARQQLEDQYNQDMKRCYQEFDVNSCRLKARDRRIDANNVLRKEEISFNKLERQIQTEEATKKLADRTSEAELKRMEAERAERVAASKDRSDANAQKQLDHALQGTKRGEYEQKQREAAQRRADVEKKLRERSKEPAAPLPVPGQ